MNIIEMAALLSVETSKIGLFTEVDFAEMERKLELEKHNHPDLTDELISQLFDALKNHSKSFQAVMNNRALFNFFAKKNLSKKQFQEESEIEDKQAIKGFIQTYLIDELNPIVYDKIGANDFQEIALLTEAHQFLPDRVSEKIIYYATEKLELANKALKPPFGDFSKILYIKDANFFTFLNGFKNETIEEQVKALFTTVMNMYIADKSSELAKRTFTAMKNYHTLDEQLSKNIGMLKESAEINYKPFAVNRKKYYWIYAVVGLILVIRVSMFISDISEMNSQYDSYQNYDDYEMQSEPRQIDRYYTDMKFKIDSFRVFLADYNQTQIRRLTKLSNIKTGQNPFETFYENQPTGESNNYLRVRNTSNYDVVLLENAVLYDSIKMPRTAHFIKAGESVAVNFNNADTKTIFNIYMGKKLATFQTESNHLFVRNGSIVEYRFSELIPNVKEVLETDYVFKNDADINFVNGHLRIDSEGLIEN
ncbi:hypothetical protein [Flavobacterium sp. UBA7682]|uniref:hypothetical protein n=1 Tax=Flavobacterium sp. UBA7682 TaxID=1946560 RepID=UPI0025C68FCA|nr:hypothetical protein [Flavobacterium sp. UBA7682]